MNVIEEQTSLQLSALAEVSDSLQKAGIAYWLFGGWAVDFYVGSVTRSHDDVDLAVWFVDVPQIAKLLLTNGWRHAPFDDEDGGTGFERGGVRLELTYLVRGDDGLASIPLRSGAVVWPGIFLWWTEELFKQADLIVWLDIPYPVAVWRIVKRHLQASLKGNNPHSGMRNLISFVFGVRKQYYQMEPIIPMGPDDDFAVTRIAIEQELEKHSGKVKHCRTSKDIGQLREILLAFKR